MSIKKGDFVLIDLTGKVKEINEVFDTTIEEVAKEAGVYKADEIYEPRLVVVGEGWVLKALDETLSNLEIAKTESIEIPPEEAFGNRDSEKVKLVSIRRLTSRGISPQIGMRLEYEGKLAVVRTIGAGRVQLDFNPPLAGKTLVYEVIIQKKLKGRKEKVKALIHRRIPVIDIEKFEVKSGKAVTISVPDEGFYIEGLQLAKRGIAIDVHRYFPKILNVKFIEEFTRQEVGGEQP